MGNEKQCRAVAIEMPEDVLHQLGLTLDTRIAGNADLLAACRADKLFVRKRDNRFSVWAKRGSAFDIVADFSMTQLPGCCGVVVFHSVEVYPAYRRQGVGRAIYRAREVSARAAGYTLALATVLANNVAEKKILRSEGWVERQQFQNVRTRNEVELWVKLLRTV